MVKISKFSNTIEYNLRTTLDSSGITKFQGELTKCISKFSEMKARSEAFGKHLDFSKEIDQIKQLQSALNKSFDVNTGLVNLKTLSSQLTESFNLKTLESSMSKVGTTGQVAFNNFLGSIGRMDSGFKNVSKTTDKIFNTMSNTVRWGITASVFQSVQNSLYRAVDYVNELDKSLNDIRIVSEQSTSQMRDFALYANQAAEGLGQTTTAFTNASLIYAQQGFDQDTSNKLAETTLKMANVTGQDTAAASEQMTSLMNGYNMSVDELNSSLDALANVAAKGASDMEELATAESKVAATASTLGVSQNQLAAQISTIISVTRQAPESVGNALKTIYARLGDLQMGDTLEDGVSLGTVSGELEKIGVNVLDVNGEMRDMGSILEDLMAKWQGIGTAQKQALAVQLAGKYQYNNLMTLLENADMYNQQLDIANNSAGTLEKQQDIYMDSLQAKMNALQSSGEGLITTLFNQDDLKPFIDGLTNVVDLVTQFVKALGGGIPVLTALGGLATRVFSKQLGNGIGNILQNRAIAKNRREDSAALFLRQQGMFDERGNATLTYGSEASGSKTTIPNVAAQMINNTDSYRQSMSIEDQKKFNASLQETVQLQNDVAKSVRAVEVAQDELYKTELLANLKFEDKLREEKDYREKRRESLSQELEEEISEFLQSARKNTYTKDMEKFVLELDEAIADAGDVDKAMANIQAEMDRINQIGESYGWTKEMATDVEELEQHLLRIKDIQDDINNEESSYKQRVQDFENYKNSEIGAARGKVAAAQADKDGAVEELSRKQEVIAQETQGYADKARIQNIIDTTGAVTQLVFAWQSFQSLGSLWANDDLSDGEKWIQTIENLVFTLPTAISSLSELASVVDKVREAQKAATAMEAASTVVEGVGSAVKTTGAAAETAAGGVGLLATAGKALSGSFLPLAGVFFAVSAAVSFFSAQAEEAAQKSQEIIDTGNEAAKALSASSDTLPKYRAAYQEFQKTGKVTDDLKNSIQTLSEAYGLSIKTDNLKAESVDRINQALEKQAQVTGRLAHDQIVDAQRETANKQENQSKGFSSKITNEKRYQSTGRQLSTQEKAEDDLINRFSSFTSGGFVKNADLAQKMGDLADAADYIDQKIEEFNEKMAGASESKRKEYQEQIDAYNDIYKQQREALGVSSEDQQEYLDRQKTLATEAVNDIANTINNSATSVEDARKKLLDNADIADYVKAQGADGGKAYIDGVLEQLGYSASEVQAGVKDLYTAPNASDLDTANKKKDELGSLVSQYQENGDFTEDEVADILQEHPEYIDYLTKVGDTYQLNQQALQAWNDATKEQTDALNELMDTSYSVLDDENKALELVRDKQGGSFGTIESDTSSVNLDNVADKVISINEALAQGKTDVSEYADDIGQAIDQLNSLNIDWDSKDALSGFNPEQAEGLAATWERIGSSISDVVQNMTEQFKRGQISLSDYLDNFADLAKQSNKVQQALGKITKSGKEWVAVTENVDEETAKANKTIAQQANETEQAADDIKNLGPVYKDLEESNADLQKWFGKGTEGLIDFSAIEQDGEKYKQVMSDMAQDMVGYFQNNTSAALSFSTDLMNQLELNAQEGQALYQQLISGNADYLTTLVTQNGQAGYALVATTLAATNQQVAAASAGIQGMVQGVITIVNGLSVEIRGEQTGSTQVSGTLLDLTQDGSGILGTLGDVAGKVSYNATIPQFKFGATVTGDGNAIKSGADQIATGGVMSGLFGSDGADLTDYAPKSGAVAPAGSFSNPGGRSSGGSGGGGGGGGKKGGGGGGGGGGGSDGPSYEPKHKDEQENEINRYEKIDTALDAIAADLEKINSEQDRLTGKQLAENMAQQIALLTKQIKLQKEKLEIQKQEAQEYKGQLASQFGVTFDDQGFIQNYAAKYKEYLDNLNGLIRQYNATTTEDGQEALDKQIEAAEKSFDKFKDLVDKYDELVSSSIKGSEQQIEEFYDKIEDMRIDAFKKAVEGADNIKDIQESMIDFNDSISGLLAGHNDDPFAKAARSAEVSFKKIGKYFDVGVDDVNKYYDNLIAKNNEALKTATGGTKNWLEYQNKILQEGKANFGKGTLEAGGTGYLDMNLKSVNEMNEQIRQYEQTGKSDIFGENGAELYDVAKTVFDQASSMVEDLTSELEDAHDAVMDMLDAIGDKLDERIDQYETINDELDHYKSLIELIHGETAYDDLNKASQAIVNNNTAQINELRQSIAVYKQMLGTMQKGSDEWKKTQEKINDMQSDLLSKTEDTMQEIQDIWNRGIEKAMDKWIKSTLGDSLDNIQSQWELINKNADQYLDEVNAAYNIQKLQSKYTQLLDGSNDYFVQKKITEQMNQQLKYLREKKNLSEYDVQYANAQLEILQKQIALEDAQRNKSQMKLRRDMQGNYSYVYSADEGKTQQAESDLLDAQNNAYNLSKDQIKQQQDNALSALQDYYNQLKQIQQDLSLTEEQRTQKSKELQDQYVQYLNGCAEQLGEAQKNIIQDFIGMVQIMGEENTGKLKDTYDQIINGNKEAFDNIDARWNTSITKWLNNMDTFNTNTETLFQDLSKNFADYQKNLDTLGDAAGVTFDNLTGHIQGSVDATDALKNSTADFIQQLKNDAGEIDRYEKRLGSLTTQIQDAKNKMRAYQEQVDDLGNRLTKKEQENTQLTETIKQMQQKIDEQNRANSGNGNGNGGGGGAQADEATAWGIAQAIWTYGMRSGWGNDPTRSTKLIQGFGSSFARHVQDLINANYRGNKLVNYDSMAYSSYKLLGYDTGGYTGEWGATPNNLDSKSGKLAILHQKELVLNETDTVNILAAVDAVRKMTTNFRNGAFEDLVSSINKYGDQMLATTAVGGQTVEQKVDINATFPNVNSRAEIEAAFKGIVENASQYAFKNR